MSSFSERYGYSQVRTQLQHDDMDHAYRVDLWNALLVFMRQFDDTRSAQSILHIRLWAGFWRRPLDELPIYCKIVTNGIKAFVLETEFNRVYDIIEFVAENYNENDEASLIRILNDTMEKNLAPFRIVNGKVLKVDQDSDVDAIEQALRETSAVPGSRHHLAQALSHLADRENPDYANSIKESISAVEAVCRRLTGKPNGTLGDGLKALRANGIPIHPSLEKGWMAIYGYTSDADGIRHAAAEAPNVGQAEARYFLVSCSAFASLLIHMAHAAGLLDGGEPETARSATAGGAEGGTT